MSEEKMVRRSVAIALGIICIVLIAGLAGAMAYYASTHSHVNSDYDSLSNENANLQEQVNSLNSKVSDLADTVNLTKSVLWLNTTTVTQAANNYTSWIFSPISPAGIVFVWVQSSTSNSTYIRVSYSVAGINYDNTVAVETGGTVPFPVVCSPIWIASPNDGYYHSFPSAKIEIRVGNTDTAGNATETVEIFYRY